MIRTGLLLGSFNPVHIGHLIVAETALSEGLVDEMWLVVSPQNPLKPASGMAPEELRLAMTRAACVGNHRLQVSDVEFHLPRPSYTVDTVRHLQTSFPDRSWWLLMGSDLPAQFHLWKEYDWLLKNVGFLIYPRTLSPAAQSPIDWQRTNVLPLNAPKIDLSSTLIRERIHANKSIRYLVPDEAVRIIAQHHLYR